MRFDDKLGLFVNVYYNMVDKSLKEEIIGWIEQSIVNEDFLEHRTCLVQSPKKIDSYSGAVFSAKVIGHTKSGKCKKLDLVVKMSIRNEIVRERYGTESYKRELFVYDEILPALKRFQEEKGIKQPFTAYPKCYHTFDLPDTEVLVLKDLRRQGFVIHDRIKPMNIDHMKLVLAQYAKLHALSFAMKDQNEEEYNRITAGHPSILKKIYLQADMMSAYRNGVNKTMDLLRESEEHELAERFGNIFEKDPYEFLEELSCDLPEETVILHGDNWNNNYMFRYKDNDCTKPTEVSILDWQLSSLHSPVLDIANFLYHVGSKTELLEMDSIISHYYEHFCTFLKGLGSDPEKLFPFETFNRHFKKYSVYALILCVTLLEVALSDIEDTPHMVEMTEDDHIGDMLVRVRIHHNLDMYRNRIIAVARNCCDNYYR